MLFFTIGETTGMATPKYLAAITRATRIAEIRKMGNDGGVSRMQASPLVRFAATARRYLSEV